MPQEHSTFESLGHPEAMGAFYYKDNILYCENIRVSDILSTAPTPFYCYSQSYIVQQINRLKDVFAKQHRSIDIRYAVKANASASILRLMAQQGVGADTVSAYEIRKSIEAGIHPNHIVFSGVGKHRDELAYAVQQEVGQINIESIAELLVLNEIATNLHKKAAIAIRFNPEVDAETHDKISTAYSHSKFGLNQAMLTEAVRLLPSLTGIECIGLSVHIGSQITTLQPFAKAFSILLETARTLQQQGLPIKVLDFGGGVGVPHYTDTNMNFTIEEYASLIAKLVIGTDWKCMIEPGRYLVAGSAALISKVLYNKDPFLIIDAGMNDMMRTALYGAAHHIAPLSLPSDRVEMETYNIVGPVCESSDVFSKDTQLPKQTPGSTLAILGVGAYGMVLSNNYNLRPRLTEILVNGDQYHVIRVGETYADLNRNEIIPSWL